MPDPAYIAIALLWIVFTLWLFSGPRDDRAPTVLGQARPRARSETVVPHPLLAIGPADPQRPARSTTYLGELSAFPPICAVNRSLTPQRAVSLGGSLEGPRVEANFPFSLDELQKVPALTERVSLGARELTVQVSRVCQFEDYGPDVDVVRVWALREDGEPLTLRDLQPAISRQDAFRLWSYLCEQLVAAARLTYGLPATDDTNPSLGCWGPRPDWVEAEIDDDSATVLMVGLAIDTQKATRPGRHELLALAVRSAVVASLRAWAATPNLPQPSSPGFSRN